VNWHAYLGLAAADVIVLVVGYALLFALGIARDLGAVGMVGLAYLAGWGALGTSLSYALVAGFRLTLVTVLVTAALLALLAGVVGVRTPKLAAARPSPPPNQLARVAAITGAAIILVAGLSALVVAARSSWTPDVDTLALWIPHAQVIYYTHGLGFGPGGWPAVYHPEYPPLVPTMYAMTFRFAGGFHPALLAVQQCLLGLAFIGAVLALLDRCVPRWLAFPSVALLIVAPDFFTRLDSQLPDQTLAYFVATAGLACVLWLRERRTAWLALAVVLSVCGTMTKLEGATYAFLLVLVVAGGAALLRSYRTAGAALVLCLGVAAIEPWRLWLASHGLPTSASDYHLTSTLHPLYLAHRVGRIPDPVNVVLRVMFSPAKWLVVLPAALLGIVAASRRRPAVAGAFATWLLLAFAGLIAVYWAGQFPTFPLREEVQITAYRVAATIVIVAGVMVPVIFSSVFEGDAETRLPP
jgi:hypothetical protein